MVTHEGRGTAGDVASFFDTHTTLPAIVEAGVEGRQGSVARNGDAVRLTIGCYEVFAGDAGSQGARQLIAGAKRPELVYGNDPAWRAVILDVRGELAGRSTAFRARGLARVASAALIAEALARNLIPCWSASNPISKRLAERLGYRPAGECEVLLLQ